MLKEELLKIEEVAGTPWYSNLLSEETEEPPSKSKRQKKDTLLSMFSEILDSSTATAPMSSCAIEVANYMTYKLTITVQCDCSPRSLQTNNKSQINSSKNSE